MRIGKTLTLALIASMLLSVVAVLSLVSADGTTIGVEPSTAIAPCTPTFKVEIWARNVADLAGVEFKLGYDTMVLTATEIAYGDVFGGTYFQLKSEIDDAEGYLHYAVMQWFGEPGVSGDGRVAIVTFTGPGESSLDLYETKLGDSDATPIYHTALDGYYAGHWEAPPNVDLYAKVVNVKEKHMSTCTLQTIKGLVTNEGTEGAYVRAQFVILDTDDTIMGVATGDAVWIDPGKSKWTTAEWHVEDPGSYYVKGVIEYGLDGVNFAGYDAEFRVVGPSWFKASE
jgi:hypothetical protein